MKVYIIVSTDKVVGVYSDKLLAIAKLAQMKMGRLRDTWNWIIEEHIVNDQ